MPDETLQVAFEIKTACDEISRKLLRWHWERKPERGSDSFPDDHKAAGLYDLQQKPYRNTGTVNRSTLDG